MLSRRSHLFSVLEILDYISCLGIHPWLLFSAPDLHTRWYYCTPGSCRTHQFPLCFLLQHPVFLQWCCLIPSCPSQTPGDQSSFIVLIIWFPSCHICCSACTGLSHVAFLGQTEIPSEMYLPLQRFRVAWIYFTFLNFKTVFKMTTLMFLFLEIN